MAKTKQTKKPKSQTKTNQNKIKKKIEKKNKRKQHMLKNAIYYFIKDGKILNMSMYTI